MPRKISKLVPGNPDVIDGRPEGETPLLADAGPGPKAAAGQPQHRAWCSLDPANNIQCSCGGPYAAQPRRLAVTEDEPLTDDQLDQLETVYRERIDPSVDPSTQGTFIVMLRLIREVKQRRAAAKDK